MASVRPPNSSSREKLREAADLAGQAASESASYARERARESVDRGRQRASDLEQRFESSIKDHPLVSVGAAFAVGWVIAKLMR
ncbi:DUF883 family protein [Microbulbifer yueqingensis]|uniref:Membrane-anchored ribosome-binding protein, inhibits growth in stationary phase, ElaB/YqjD/DUF883 family n=1 Tax=Microbulbifer yueqingensis TaxID=658219 RepID=A0A1G8VW33_9GAMM|nr:hypothetical protein [Microbulbifer yueqingensis]SDJ70209.1 Membrane-anchored ribosome-binding protein, inhibits growth in stationary phase, ElaB/YqjD/DUF883 family [Microbulbifer yueqingensis]